MSKVGVTQTDLCGVGFAPEQAQLMTLTVQSAVAATGSVLSQAFESQADIVYVSSVHANTNDGIMLRQANAYRRRQVVINGTANTMKVYPPSSSGSINNQLAGSALSLGSGVAAAFDSIGENLFWART